jgi:hypothetical protein
MTVSRRDQRNFFPALILTVVWWGLLLALVWQVDPDVIADFPFTGSYGLFFTLVFLAVWFLSSLILINSRRGFLLATGVVIYGYLRLAQLGNWFNAILLLGFFLALEFFLSTRRLTKSHPPRTKHDNEPETTK